jgi:hypothetical protein
VSPTTLYTLGFFVALAALVYGAVLLRIPDTWIVIGALLVNCVGILWASSYISASGPPKP